MSSEDASGLSRSRTNNARVTPLCCFTLALIVLIVAGGARSVSSSASQGAFFDFSPSVFSANALSSVSVRAVGSFGSPALVLIGGASLRAASPPVTVSSRALGAGTEGYGEAPPEMIRYAAREGDTPLSVAEKFSISEETVLGVNELSSGAVLHPGQDLVILPVSGALHMVREFDTLSEIASWYKGDAREIAHLNGLSSSEEIFAGDLLIIPGGVQPKSLPSGRLTPIANSYFIYPLASPHKITQGLHAFNAIDFSNGSCGGPVYAAAGGQIQRTGYSGIGGNYVRIMHPNGVVTYYGHLSRAAKSAGQRVSQGEIIGTIGYSGYTIPAGPGGCHLHFEVRGARNPFAG